MKNYLILAAIALVSVSLIAIFYFAQPKVTPETNITELNGLEIAKMSYGFFGKMRREDGLYNYYEVCNEADGRKECEILSRSVIPVNAWVMLADLGLYDATGEQKYLDSAKSDFEILTNGCKDNSGCLWTLVQMSRLYKRTNNPAYLEKIKGFADALIENKTRTGVMMTGIEARQFAIVYGLTGDQKYLAESLERLEKSDAEMGSEDVMYDVNGFQVRNFVCSAELARLELYEVTGDRKYLEEVENFFDAAEIGSHRHQLRQQTVIQPCIESLFTLYRKTGNEKYWGQAYNLTDYMITYRWDSPLEQAEKYNGDGAFLFSFYTYNNTKTVTDTAYAVYLLTLMKDIEFNIVRWR